MRWKRRRKSEPPKRPDRHARPAALDDDPDPVDTWFRYCPTCDTLAAGGYVFYLPHGVNGVCRLDCERERVTMRQAVAVTGMSEEAILTELYASIRNPDNPMRVEAATRLGMAPPQPTERIFEEVDTESVSVALATVTDQAVPAVPVIDEPRLRAEFLSVKKSWSSRGLWSGTAEEATEILGVNLERDVLRPDFRHFRVDVIPSDLCAQVSTLYGGVFTGYRIWRTPDRLHFCGGKLAILGYGSPDAHGGRAAMWHDHGLLPLPPADAARGKKARTDQLLDELFTIALTRGFLTRGEADPRTREIGAELDRTSGLRKMREAHAVVNTELGRTHARELDSAWDGIGRWLG